MVSVVVILVVKYLEYHPRESGYLFWKVLSSRDSTAHGPGHASEIHPRQEMNQDGQGKAALRP